MGVADKQGNIISIVRNHRCSLGEGPLMTIQGGGTYGTGDIAGGNTNILFDISSGEFVSSYGSLVGAIRPCAGGPTPWGSWLSAEETFPSIHSVLNTVGSLTSLALVSVMAFLSRQPVASTTKPPPSIPTLEVS